MILHIKEPGGGSSRVCSEAWKCQGPRCYFSTLPSSTRWLCVVKIVVHSRWPQCRTATYSQDKRGKAKRMSSLDLWGFIWKSNFSQEPSSILAFFLYWSELATCQPLSGHWERRQRISQPVMTYLLSLGAGPAFPEIKGSLPTAWIKWGSVFGKEGVELDVPLCQPRRYLKPHP